MTFKEMKIVGDTVKVHFDNTYGAYNRFEGIKGFEVAGEDKVFHPATAKHFWQEGERRMERVHHRNQSRGKEASGFALLLPQLPARQHGECRRSASLPIPYRQLVINNIAVDLCEIQRPTVLSIYTL